MEGEAGFTNITDEEDLSVGRNMLGEEGLLVISWWEFMLTGWIWFIRGGGCEVKELKPSLCSNSYYKVLLNQEKKVRHKVRNIIKISETCCCVTNLLFLCCRHRQQQHRSTSDAKHKSWIRETIHQEIIRDFCTHHAHTCPGDPGFGFIILVHQQLSTGVPHNQLIQLQGVETDRLCYGALCYYIESHLSERIWKVVSVVF